MASFEPESTAPDGGALERLLKRDRAITLASLIVLGLLAWVYVLSGAGLGMSAWEMTLRLFGDKPAMPSGDMMNMSEAPKPWALKDWFLIIAMWWVMMVGMMTPSAAPAILLFAKVYRHAVTSTHRAAAPSGSFVAGYLTAWLAFAIAAAAAQWALQRAGLLSEMLMNSQNRAFSGGVLIAAGLYELSPLKGVCLSHCRSPANFLTRHWRAGRLGAMRLGVLHGAYCVGCCWLLMALLFVGGVMNVLWIFLLAALVWAEKAAPQGAWIARLSGVVFLIAGAAVLGAQL